jgi:hypothetical protein
MQIQVNTVSWCDQYAYADWLADDRVSGYCGYGCML